MALLVTGVGYQQALALGTICNRLSIPLLQESHGIRLYPRQSARPLRRTARWLVFHTITRRPQAIFGQVSDSRMAFSLGRLSRL